MYRCTYNLHKLEVKQNKKDEKENSKKVSIGVMVVRSRGKCIGNDNVKVVGVRGGDV